MPLHAIPNTIVRTLLVSLVLGLSAPWSTHADPKRDLILTESKSLYSQGPEERIVRHFFNDKRDGFFLDVGSFHWKEASTTLYLEERLGWSGIAIDAQSRYSYGYEKHRPKTKFFAYLVTDHSGDTGTLYLAGPLSSTNKNHVKEFPAVAHHKPKPIQVKTITLDDLLEQNDVEKIDFLSMDIEGAEVDALAGFSIQRYRPELVCIEVHEKNREAVLAYFKKHHYKQIGAYLEYDWTNWYFTPETGSDEKIPGNTSH